MSRLYRWTVAFLVLGLAALLSVPSATAQTTTADDVAERLVEAHGADAFASMPYLRFDFAVRSDQGTQVVARALWNRSDNIYRVEMTQEGTPLVVLVDVDASAPGSVEGTAYRDGSEVTGEDAAPLLQAGYQRFINDTYWLLAPLKVFDEGVNRSYVADSSTAEHDVLHLTFGDVGLTPDDEYWLYVDKETGQLDRWAFRLQSMDDNATPAAFEWTDYVTLETPNGDVRLAETHAGAGGRDILTNNLAAPTSVPDETFNSPTQVLE